jgi:hypothetical protein
MTSETAKYAAFTCLGSNRGSYGIWVATEPPYTSVAGVPDERPSSVKRPRTFVGFDQADAIARMRCSMRSRASRYG